LQHDHRGHGLTDVELPSGQGLGGGERSVALGDVDVEPTLLPEPAIPGDEGVDERTLGHPGQGETHLGDGLGAGTAGTAL
jgi:hypothetical protein